MPNTIKFLAIIFNSLIIFTMLGNSFGFLNNLNAFAADQEIAQAQGSTGVKAEDFCNSGQILCRDIDRGKMYIGDKLLNKPIPTNRIWSSVVFLGKLTGLYAMPIVAKTDNGELKLGQPNYNAQVGAKTYSGILDSSFGLGADNNAITSVWVEDYSDLTVKLGFRNAGNQTIFLVNFVQGSPYIFVESKVDKLNINLGNYSLQSLQGNNYLTDNNATLGIFTSARIDKQVAKLTLDFGSSSTKFLTFALAEDRTKLPDLAKYAINRIESINANFGVNRTTVETTYNISYVDGGLKNTIFGLLPHQYGSNINNYLYKLQTVRGQQNFQLYGSKIRVLMPKQPLLENLPLVNLNEVQKLELIKTLSEDSLNTDFAGAEASYEGGKVLARAGRLIQIADSLGENTIRDELVQKLGTELQNNWYQYKDGKNSKFFQYDKNVGTLIAQKDGYGSATDINDHHFHYGYHLFAASMVAKYDSGFLARNRDFINMIARDITNLDRNSTEFSFIRNYDFFEGHSWAAGTATFGDGNNQESTSEAINAWYSVWLWGRVSGNADLQNLGTFLYTNEANSTNYYWLNASANKTIFPSGYQQNIASIVWGGKADYATFFSADDLAINGIQYLPFTPGSMYLYNRKTIDRDFAKFGSLAQSRTDDWVDLNGMYYSMIRGREIYNDQKWSTIKVDNGSSRSNIYSWLNFWDNNQGIARLVGTNYSGVLMVKDTKYYLIIDCNIDGAISIGTKSCIKGMNIFENPNSNDTKALLMNQYQPTLTSELYQIIQTLSKSLGS